MFYSNSGQRVKVGLFRVVFILLASFLMEDLLAQQIFTWVGTEEGSWKQAVNWQPQGIPGSNSVVRFEHEGVCFISDVPNNLHLRGLQCRGKSTTFLSAEVANSSILIGAVLDPNCALEVGPEATMVIWGENSSKWQVNRGIEGCIEGTVALLGSGDLPVRHTFEPLGGPPALRFRKGSRFVVGNGFQLLSGHPFGTAVPEQPFMVFDSGATLIQNDGLDPFGPSITNPQVQFEPGSTFQYSDNVQGNVPAFFGRVFPNLTFSSFGQKNVVGQGVIKCNNLFINTGTLNFAPNGGTGNAFEVSGNISLRPSFGPTDSGALIIAPLSGSGRLFFAGADTQMVNGGASIRVRGRGQVLLPTGSKVLLNAPIVTEQQIVSSGGEVNVQEGAFLGIPGENTISGTGRFFMRPSAVLGIGSAQGIMASKDSGNIRTANRVYANAIYQYMGSTNQTTGDGLINWNSTGVMPELRINMPASCTLSLSASRRVGIINLQSGNFNTNGLSLTLRGLNSGGPGGAVAPAIFKVGKGKVSNDAANGSIIFEGAGRFEASDRIDVYNITLNNGVLGSLNFGLNNQVHINGRFRLATNLINILNPPFYSTGSTLVYAASATSFVCGSEWTPNAAIGRGIPFNVQVGDTGVSGATLNFNITGNTWRSNGAFNLRGNSNGVVLADGVVLSVGGL